MLDDVFPTERNQDVRSLQERKDVKQEGGGGVVSMFHKVGKARSARMRVNREEMLMMQ